MAECLTTHGVVLDSGAIIFNGPSEDAILSYTQATTAAISDIRPLNWGRGVHTAIQEVRFLDHQGQPTRNYEPGKNLRLEVVFETDGTSGLSVDGFLLDQNRAKIAYFSDYQFHGRTLPTRAGVYVCHIELEALWLASGSYSFDLATAVINSNWDHYVESAIEFDAASCNPKGFPWDFKQHYGYGQIALICTMASRCEPAEPTQEAPILV